MLITFYCIRLSLGAIVLLRNPILKEGSLQSKYLEANDQCAITVLNTASLEATPHFASTIYIPFASFIGEMYIIEAKGMKKDEMCILTFRIVSLVEALLTLVCASCHRNINGRDLGDKCKDCNKDEFFQIKARGIVNIDDGSSIADLVFENDDFFLLLNMHREFFKLSVSYYTYVYI
jgi:hypothetical protein